MKTEFYVLKSFVTKEVYNIDKSIYRVRTECDHMQCQNDIGAKPQTKNEIIKTLFENFSNTANLSVASHKTNSNQNLAEHFQNTKYKFS